GEEADAAHRPVPKLHIHLPEIVLAEFTGQPLETYQGLDLLRPQRSHHAIKRALAPRVAHLPDSPQHLYRWQVSLLLQNLDHQFPEILDQAGPADPPLGPLRRIVDMHH